MKFKNIILLFSSSLILISCGSDEQSKSFVPEIPVYKITAEDVPIYHEFVGQVFGFKDISIRARVEGFLEGIYFDEGRSVKKGQLLYEIESQPFEADVAAKMSLLAEAKTMLVNSESELNRIRPLAEINAVSQSDLDAAVARFEASQASVEAAEAILRAAKIQLSYTRIHSPITGLIGKTKAKVGDFVGKDPNPVILNVVSRIDIILVEFFITESQYLIFAREVDKNREREEVEREEPYLELILSDGSIHNHKGIVEFVDRQVDPTTGSILLQASFPNPDYIIRPGQFARINASVRTIKNGILIPQRSVMEMQGIHNVYVINNENKVELRRIKVGPTVDSFWLVDEGLNNGEKVVYEGLQKVKPGMTVNPVLTNVERNNKETGN
ncbi:MAG: efflux RND transporter periplasmic adaptor subunit [Ignavibacteriae bacterium]|nr:MAG: efflux RND transporter periplasmic adaptor subunit [Ignavibacteriota bacterium]